MFQIKNVSKKFGSEYALKNININIGSGMNFIIGASGSGKTTLLKIISGLESEFEGESLYLGKSIKSLSEEEKSYFYNNLFGFVWQDFNIIEDMTVEENLLLPMYLKKIQNKKEITRILKKLRIENLRDQKVKLLSGGQKQRVAIARELLKNPKVIIADEPTSALDDKTSKEVINILKEISKERTVIVVTHDTSFIDEKSKVYELDKGELISAPEDNIKEFQVVNTKGNKGLKLSNSYKIGMANIKSKLGRSLVTCLSIIVSSVLLVTSMGGTIKNVGQQSFDELFKNYGDGILDLGVISSFISASGTGGNEDDGPNADVNQDIGGLYEKYINDDRVSHILYSKAFDNINITMDGKDYSIQQTGNAPVANKFIVGQAPKGKGEVVVSEQFIKQANITPEESIGKTIDFKGSIFNWNSGEPVPKDINVQGTIVGVVDTTIKSEFEGKIYEFTIDDSFFFDKDTLTEIYKQAEQKNASYDFVLRARSPQDLIDIKNEITAQGIVPLGQFKLIEDTLKLNNQANSQSGGATAVIGGISIVALGAISLVTSLMRKREYAIYKVCGYSNKELSVAGFAENNIILLISSVLFLILSPAINILTKSAFGVEILSLSTLFVSIGMILVTSFICFVICTIVARGTQPSLVLKSGGK